MQLFTNNAKTTLANGISNSALSLQVAVGEGSLFPNPTGGQFFLLTLFKVNAGAETTIEIIRVTARSADVLTIVRGQEGTTEQTYLAGDFAQLRVTAGTHATLDTHVDNVANPHATTKAQVGLANVDNTSDVNKPVSTAQATADSLVATNAASDATTKANAAAAASAPIAHVGSGGAAHANVVAAGAAGFMTGADKTKLDGVATGATANTGTVTTVSVATANGFTGTVATAGTTPAITLTTNLTGLVKGNGTALSAAVVRTDYAEPTTALATGILKNTTSTGAHTIAIAADFPVLNQNTTGSAATVTNATLTTALTVNTGTVTVVGNVANTSVLTLGAGASSVSGANTGDNAANTTYAADYRLANFRAGIEYQVPLVSNTHVKTINGQSLVGSGNVVIAGAIVENKRSITASTATTSLDLNIADNATVFKLALNANTTLTFSNPPPMVGGEVFTFTLMVVRDATAGRTLAFGNSIKWSGAIVPPQITAANTVDFWTFFYENGVLYGTLAMNDAR